MWAQLNVWKWLSASVLTAPCVKRRFWRFQHSANERIEQLLFITEENVCKTVICNWKFSLSNGVVLSLEINKKCSIWKVLCNIDRLDRKCIGTIGKSWNLLISGYLVFFYKISFLINTVGIRFTTVATYEDSCLRRNLH